MDNHALYSAKISFPIRPREKRTHNRDGVHSKQAWKRALAYGRNPAAEA